MTQFSFIIVSLFRQRQQQQQQQRPAGVKGMKEAGRDTEARRDSWYVEEEEEEVGGGGGGGGLPRL